MTAVPIYSFKSNVIGCSDTIVGSGTSRCAPSSALLEVTRELGDSSPLITLAALDGKPVPDVVITLDNLLGAPGVLTIKLRDAYFTHVGLEDLPTIIPRESIGFDFTTITWDFAPANGTGSAAGMVELTWHQDLQLIEQTSPKVLSYAELHVSCVAEHHGKTETSRPGRDALRRRPLLIEQHERSTARGARPVAATNVDVDLGHGGPVDEDQRRRTGPISKNKD